MTQFLGRLNRMAFMLSRPLISKSITNKMEFEKLSRFLSFMPTNPFAITQPTPLLQSSTPMVQQSCGMKVKGKLRRRCKDCYFVWREERLYVMCKTHGRHKQMSMKKKPHNTWTLTTASQSKVRPW
uniref:Ribosomal protein n=1 Tax=Culicoides sonorensis TaxID=179676 RepID=A0A336M086_CULSO